MGLPPIPRSVPEDRIRFVDMRVRAADCEPGVEDVMELYYTDTGETIQDPDEDDEDDKLRCAEGDETRDADVKRVRERLKKRGRVPTFWKPHLEPEQVKLEV